MGASHLVKMKRTLTDELPTSQHTELVKKVCPRLRDSACWLSGEITQPRTNFFGLLCTSSNIYIGFMEKNDNVYDSA